MNRKDILELKRRFKKDHCTFTRMSGCYVNSQKETLLEFDENFLTLPDEDFFKYMEICKKALSGGVCNNLLELNFPLDENYNNEKQNFLMRLKKSGLKNPQINRVLYEEIIDTYDYAGNFLILLFHDAYDVMVKTKDNIKMDDSEEVYEYILCAICPVSLSKPALGYFKTEEKIKARIRDWIVELPTNGFVFPAFIDRSTDINAVMYYTKNTKAPHPELMEKVLGCQIKQTATIQKETFEEIIKSTVSSDDEVFKKVYTDIQENLNTMVEEHNELYEDTNEAPITLSKDKVKDLLIESGISEEATTKIQTSYEENFGKDMPLAENLVDSKIIKANSQKKKEEELTKKVEALETKLEQVTTTSDTEDTIGDSTDDVSEFDHEDTNSGHNEIYDVVLQVKPDKLSKIKTELIDGQRYLFVPIDDDEQATINGRNDLI